MINSEICLIIMDPLYEVLGEILISHGVCKSISLNKKGDELLGLKIEDWQIHGLGRMKFTSTETEEGINEVFYEEMIKMNSGEFEDALREWLDDHGFIHYTLPLAAMGAWSEIQRQDISNQQKFEMGLMLASLPMEKMII